MQAIQTKYHGPTDRSGSRITARCDAGRIVMPYDHALDIDGNHRKAARRLLRKLGWDKPTHGGEKTPRMASGTLVDGSQVHTFCFRTTHLQWDADDYTGASYQNA